MKNLPNILTLARLALLPVIVLLLWPGIESRETCFWAAALWAAGGTLDVVDGFIARRFNLVTVLGKFLDPLSDKLFYLVTLLALVQLDGPRVPVWVVMVTLVRELAVTGLRGIAASEGMVIAAGRGGKVKTSFASVGLIFLLIHYTYSIDFGLIQASLSFHRVGLWLTYISVVFSLSSGLGYMSSFLKAHSAKVASTSS